MRISKLTQKRLINKALSLMEGKGWGLNHFLNFNFYRNGSCEVVFYDQQPGSISYDSYTQKITKKQFKSCLQKKK